LQAVTIFAKIPLMKKQLVLLLLLALSFPAFSQEPLAFQWVNASGRKSSYSKMLAAAKNADIVLFGELHDDPIAHWFQLLLTEDIYAAHGKNLVIGSEMIERDQQERLNKYLSGEWELKTFKDSAKMWSNFDTDYLPVVDFAKENGLKYVAANIPRPYASRVFKKGLASLDSLPAAEKQWIVPLPFEMDTTLSQYSELIKMGKEMHASGIDFAYAQAIKDATMAHSILQSWSPGKHFIHFNGAYHSDFHQSIYWYLKKSNPSLKIVTISTVSQESLKKPEAENLEKADFILITPSEMTRTM
jgi:uncharacterized iron-regulated protein